MNKLSIRILTVIFTLTAAPAFAGKWLDYGYGLINIEKYTFITPQVVVNPLLGCIDGKVYEAFSTEIKKIPEEKRKTAKAAFTAAIYFDNDAFTLTIVDATCDKDEADNALADAMKRVIKLLSSNDGYLQF